MRGSQRCPEIEQIKEKKPAMWIMFLHNGATWVKSFWCRGHRNYKQHYGYDRRLDTQKSLVRVYWLKQSFRLLDNILSNEVNSDMFSRQPCHEGGQEDLSSRSSCGPVNESLIMNSLESLASKVPSASTAVPLYGCCIIIYCALFWPKWWLF